MVQYSSHGLNSKQLLGIWIAFKLKNHLNIGLIHSGQQFRCLIVYTASCPLLISPIFKWFFNLNVRYSDPYEIVTPIFIFLFCFQVYWPSFLSTLNLPIRLSTRFRMGDPAKDYYQERLVQAWSAAAVAAGYAPHHALDTSAHSQVNTQFPTSIILYSG